MPTILPVTSKVNLGYSRPQSASRVEPSTARVGLGHRMRTTALRHSDRVFDPSEQGPIVKVVKALEIGFALAAVLALSTVMFPVVAPAGQSEPGSIRGFEVMGDKGRSALDGFSQAPVPREQSAAMDASDPGGRSIAGEKARAIPTAAPTLGHGQEPQEPLPVVLPGPANNILAGP